MIQWLNQDVSIAVVIADTLLLYKQSVSRRTTRRGTEVWSCVQWPSIRVGRATLLQEEAVVRWDSFKLRYYAAVCSKPHLQPDSLRVVRLDRALSLVYERPFSIYLLRYETVYTHTVRIIFRFGWSFYCSCFAEQLWLFVLLPALAFNWFIASHRFSWIIRIALVMKHSSWRHEFASSCGW